MAPVTLPDRSWLDAPPTRKLTGALANAGIDFRFVGGVVRDSLLGRSVADIDLATPARPDAVMRAVAAAGLKAVPTGIAHGTVTAVADGKPFEITTLRRDVETDGRRAVVAFTDDWRQDAARRDFTMNALYADQAGQVTDFFGGAADARAGRVRFIGDAAERIAEDGLRILRFFRFHAWFGQGAPDPTALAACASHAGMIGRLSSERVRVELFKLLCAPDPVPAWRAMTAAGVVAEALPDATRVDDLARLVATERALGREADPVRRLAALTGPVTDQDVARIKARLKLSNRDEAHLRFLDGAGERIDRIGEGGFGRALYGAVPAFVRDAALLAHVRSGTPDAAALATFDRFGHTWREPRFPLSGADLKARGLSAGPAMGHLLDEMKGWWAAGSFSASRAECLAELDRRMRSSVPTCRPGGSGDSSISSGDGGTLDSGFRRDDGPG